MMLPFGWPLSTSSSSTSSTPSTSPLFFRNPRRGTPNKANPSPKTPLCPLNHLRPPVQHRLTNSHNRRGTPLPPNIRYNRSRKHLT